MTMPCPSSTPGEIFHPGGRRAQMKENRGFKAAGMAKVYEPTGLYLFVKAGFGEIIPP